MIAIKSVTYTMELDRREFLALWKLLGELSLSDHRKADLSDEQIRMVDDIFSAMNAVDKK